MEVKSVSGSSLSDAKLTRSEKKKIEKQRKHQAIENGNAESKEGETSLGAGSKLDSEAKVSLDSRLREWDNSFTKDAHLEAEQLTGSRRKRKRKEKSSTHENQSYSFMESKVNVSLRSRLKEEANSSMKDSHSERNSNVETSDICLESGLAGNPLNEQRVHSERKRKRGKEAKEGAEFVVELRDIKENSLIDEKQSDSPSEAGLKGLQLSEQPADSEMERKGKKERKKAKAQRIEKLDKKSLVEMRDGKPNSLIDEKQGDSPSETGLKGFQLSEQPADSERKRMSKKDRKKTKAQQIEKLDKKSLVELREGKENSLIDEKQSDSHLETGLKGFQLSEQPAGSERKRKSKKEHKKTKAQQIEKLDEKSLVELRDGKENSLIDEKQSDLLLESKLNVSLELGLKEGKNLLIKDTLLEKDSHVEPLEKISLESQLKARPLNEQPADSERRRKRKECKMAKARQFEELDQKSAVELRDGKENFLIDEKRSDSLVESKLNVSLESGLKEGANSFMKDTLLETDSLVETLQKNSKENSLIEEKQTDCYVESKVSVSLKSGLKEGANSDLGTLGNVSFKSGLKVDQLNEQAVQLERKRKRKRKREKRKKRGHSVLEDKDISSERNDRDSNEAENNSMCPEPQIVNGKNFRNEDLMSISENVELQNMKKISLVADTKSDSLPTASTSVVETQNLHVEGDIVMPEVEVIKTFQIGKTEQRYHRKRKKSSNLLGDGLVDPVQENVMIQTSIDHLKKEHTDGLSENRSHGGLAGYSIPAQVLGEVCDNSTWSEAALKGKKSKKRKKLKKLEESLCNYPDQKDVEIEIKNEELIPSLSNLAVAKDDVALKTTLKENQKDVEIETKKEERIPSLSNGAVAKDDVALKTTRKENNLSQTLYCSLQRTCISRPTKKLLVLDLNGILVDVVQNPVGFKPDIMVSGKGVFKRPFCDDFLQFCFRTFNIGIWSSRINKNVNRLVSFLMRKWRRNLLFCWNRKQCTITKFKTLEDEQKPLVLKELRKLWEKHLPNLPWKKGEYDESNTLLLDDSPYKALCNPANTAIFPLPYQYRDAKDSSLGRGGDIRKYLEGLAAAENVQKYVEQNPFGLPAITETDPHWDFYCQIIHDKT